MKFSLPLITLLLGLALSGASAGEETAAAPLTAVLTDAEADRLVREEWIERERAVQSRFEQLDQAHAVQRSWVDLGERRVYFNQLPGQGRMGHRSSASPVPSGDPGFASEASVDDAEVSPGKPHHFLMVLGVSRSGGITELQWSLDGHEYRGYSAAELELLPAMLSVETDEASFGYALLIHPHEPAPEAKGDPDVAGLAVAPISDPRQKLMQAGIAYVVLSDVDVSDEDPAIGGMDALHQYLLQSRERLLTEQHNRVVLEAARQRLGEQIPERPRDTVTNFIPLKPHTYPRQRDE